ncbi:PAAR-like domain-containing protein [Burkholderia ubonensis]|uniref:PAAR-like domain-containing protein n=1 Tax=Burkholderia ubonensis TaxID=101571 RepID=UPI000ADE07AF|nr:PAAR-like domain-containing protein [Burkholderia ubonensis]
MAKLGAHKVSEFKAVSTAPSINKTQVGSSVVPLPYPTTQDLGSSTGVVPTVRFRGTPAYVLDQSTQPSCTGDSPGGLKGVKSGTVNGEVKPTSGSGSVRAGGKYVVRIGDSNTMNGGNNPGIYVAAPASSGMSAKAAAGGADQSPAQNATPAEQTFMDKVKRTAKELAQGYKDNVSPTLHEAADKAMDAGGKVAGAGGVTMLAGAGVAATGIGLPVAAGMEAAGGAGVTVGGAVGTIGGVTEAGASTMDSAADWILTGKAPDFVSTAIGIVENAVINRITSMIPGGRAVVTEAKALKTEVKTEARAVENEVKQEKKAAEQAAKRNESSSGGKDNVNVPGRGDDQGRCRLRPYDDGCPFGATPHHVVPDHCFKQPGDKGEYYNTPIRHGNGLSVCVDGKAKSSGKNGGTVKKNGRRLTQYYREFAQHGQIHARFDIIEAALGRLGTPRGTATLGQLEDVGAGVVSQVTGCNKEDLKRQLRAYHQSKGLPPSTRLRADPFGKIKDLNPASMGLPNQNGGGMGF